MPKPTRQTFNLGDRVEWTSQAGGYAKTKQGIVDAVVLPGERPDRDRYAALYKGPGAGFGRNEESYVVLVGTRPFWPRTRALRHASEAAANPAPMKAS